jgi:hypothetical protein
MAIHKSTGQPSGPQPREIRTVIMLALILILLVGAFGLSDVAMGAGDPGFEGNAECEECLDNAWETLQRCYEIWDYGEGDPDCEARYQQSLYFCETTMCIF